ARSAAVVVAFVGAAAVVASCSSSHKTATPASSAPAPASSALSSGPSEALSSVPITAFPASPLASAASSLPPPVSSEVPGAPLVANIEAPAIKAGFQVRLHKGSIIKVDAPQAKAGTPVTFALVPATSTFLTPIAGQDGYYTGAADGVVNVTVMQGGAAIGTLTVTVWG
ncbi:MAG TPA: hypothetical protein VK662_05745, partial [Acidothermaceae bacterium]|nr:hypothetical protein [Acidothermaceae bacterium]